jgi:hypothetical protein
MSPDPPPAHRSFADPYGENSQYGGVPFLWAPASKFMKYNVPHPFHRSFANPSDEINDM